MSSAPLFSKTSIPYFESVETYNFKINISPPRYADFDIRDFEENMKTVRLRMPPFRISFYQVAIVRSGGGVAGADDEKRKIGEYTLFFNLPGQILYWEVPQNWRGYYVCVQESFYTVPAEGYPRLYDLPYFKDFTPAIALNEEEAGLLLDIFRRMNEEYTHPTPYNKPIIKSYLATLLSYCIRFYDLYTEKKLAKARRDSLGERFKEQVHKHIMELRSGLSHHPLSAGKMADMLAVSPQHLSDTIKRDLGLTPTEYINERLVNEAGKVLRSTGFQVKEVAYQLGFTDASYFSRLFRKVKGITPAAYRKGE